ncbi:MAG: ammonium transporter [Solirubrobacteraceae bacterium]|nr:ammonium transporter [Solirubrobacteraceae bacterium]
MRRTLATRALPATLAGIAVSLIAPGIASADTLEAAGNGLFTQSAGLNTLWVMVAACLVFFMQAGFLLLELGFSRGKNAGTLVAKILVNLSIASLGFWAVGFAFAFGAPAWDSFNVIGGTGFLLRDFGDPATAFPVMGIFDVTVEAKFFFQFAFCAVSLAIVWGSTLERIKFGVYVMYAIVFSTIIYPIGAHWVFGGGFLQNGDWLGLGIVGMQDFAGSTAVHLIGATGALAALLLLGPRKGKYGPDGKPRAIPGHNMPLFGLGVIILWLGWFGFNGGTALSALDGRFPEIIVVTNLAAACGVLACTFVSFLMSKTIDIGMAGNGAIAALVGITAPSGYVEAWAAIPIGLVAGGMVPIFVALIDKKVDDPVGVLTVHGLAGVWGTIACGLFTAPRLAQYNAFGSPDGGLFYSWSFDQLIAQVVGFCITFGFVFVLSYLTFFIIKKTYGLRVTEEEEDAGLDITEHGMYGYPEQFIPAPELIGYSPSLGVPTSSAAPTSKEVPAT